MRMKKELRILQKGQRRLRFAGESMYLEKSVESSGIRIFAGMARSTILAEVLMTLMFQSE